MGLMSALALLTLSAVLEAGGDAMVRTGLHSATPNARAGWMLLGAAALFAYGTMVNLPPWDFGRLLGVYVALFFLITQALNMVAFGQRPTLPIMVGGTLIVAGGLIITFWQRS